jgi:hypothetical protein
LDVSFSDIANFFACFSCPQVLFLTCTDTFPYLKHHPILKVGVTVQIGMSKTCKLMAVFNRYVEFCNEHASGSDQSPKHKIDLSELEFVHCEVLNGNDTAETAALMKNDRISVRREQSDERKEEETRLRLQRESDKAYFTQLRQFLPQTTSSGRTCRHFVDQFADVVLDCRGELPYVVEGYNVPIPSKLIRCHSFMIHKRCPWLSRMIEEARMDGRRSVISVPETKDSEEDQDFELLQFKVQPPPPLAAAVGEDAIAAQIEDDENHVRRSSDGSLGVDLDDGETSIVEGRSESLIYVPINNHAVEAMKLLLEYCYTNRVIPLGYHAFMDSCKTKPTVKKFEGPVAPFSNRTSRWTNNGEPLVSFAVALAGIRLAEEASLPRLSLMCEIAAGRLVCENSAIHALLACEEQKKRTNNPLTRLRQSAMEIILRSDRILTSRGIGLLLEKALEDQGSTLVPTLLLGAAEAVESLEKKKKKSSPHGSSSGGGIAFSSAASGLGSAKSDWQTAAYASFSRIDKMEAKARERERRKRRLRRDNDAGGADRMDDDDDDYYFGEDDDVDRFVLGAADGTTVSSNRFRRKWQFYDTPAEFWDLDFAENNAAAAAAAAMAGHSLTRYTTTRRGTKSHRRGSH